VNQTDDAEVLVPGPETRAKVAGLLDKIAQLAEEIAFAQRELALIAPVGFTHTSVNSPGGVCCASPMIGYTV